VVSVETWYNHQVPLILMQHSLYLLYGCETRSFTLGKGREWSYSTCTANNANDAFRILFPLYTLHTSTVYVSSQPSPQTVRPCCQIHTLSSAKPVFSQFVTLVTEFCLLLTGEDLKDQPSAIWLHQIISYTQLSAEHVALVN